MKKIRRLTAIIFALTMTTMMLTACGGNSSSDADTSADTSTLFLVDENQQEFTYTLDDSIGMDLRSGLVAEGLVSKEDSAAFMIETIDGHKAPMEDGVLWLPCDENKEQIMGLFEEITIEGGKTYYLIYTVAPNFDD